LARAVIARYGDAKKSTLPYEITGRQSVKINLD
jgi:hypothetical protein